MRAILMLAAMVMTTVPFLVGPAFAGCPDEVKCKQQYMSIEGKSSWQTIGTIHTDTCFKFPIGCRPWFCDGEKDRGWVENHAHWQKKCDEKFPECTDDHAGHTEDFCMPHFVTY